MSRVSAPPGRSLWDASQPTLAASTAANTVPDAQNTDIVGKAMKDMQSTARDDFQRYDLKDLLVNSSREAQYSELPAGVRVMADTYFAFQAMQHSLALIATA